MSEHNGSEGDVVELENLSREQLRGMGAKALRQVLQRELKRIRTYTPKIGVFGVTGVGKSSLCNALFGKDVAEVSDVAACTRNPQEVLLSDDEGGGLVLIDVPGVGESEERDREYLALYSKLVPELDLVLWAIKADDRAYASSVKAFREAVQPHRDQCPVVFVITHADKMEPLREWTDQPGERQRENLELKKQEIEKAFGLSDHQIVAVSAHERYNLTTLVSTVVSVLPNQKKASFVREAEKTENVTDDARVEAETGILDYLAEKIGDAIFTVKEFIDDFIDDVATKHGAKILKVVTAWFIKRV